MIEIFKTDISDRRKANRIVHRLTIGFPDLKANVDLKDPENILRIESAETSFDRGALIRFLREEGCVAEIVNDTIPSSGLHASSGFELTAGA
jgi:hypothetical protein